jgi:hypothetical protein
MFSIASLVLGRHYRGYVQSEHIYGAANDRLLLLEDAFKTSPLGVVKGG